jgi:hypothetical protein
LNSVFAGAPFPQTPDDLLGDWTVTKVILSDNLPPEMKVKLTDMINNFQKAKFHFNADKEFILDIPDKNFQIKSAKWSYDEIQKIVSIKGKDPMGHVGILLKFGIRIEESTYYFLLEETPFMLQVKKVLYT